MEASVRLNTPETIALHIEAQRLGLQLYSPSEQHDLLLTRWWSYLLQSSTFPLTFPDNLRPLSHFLNHFRSPTLLLFAPHPDTIHFATWLEPYSNPISGAFIGHWCHPTTLHTKFHARCTYVSLLFATTAFPVLLAFTRHEKLLRSLARLGYTVLGTVPSFIEGHDAYAAHLTRTAFLCSAFAQHTYPRIRKE